MTTDWTLIYCYRPGWREWERELSKRAIAHLIDVYGTEHIRVCPSNGRTGYSQVVADHWALPGDLIICEQDMEPNESHIQGLLECTALACSQAYWMMPASTGHFVADLSGMKYGEQWAKHAAIGLCRLTEKVRAAMPPPPPLFWGDVENYINKVAQQGAQQWHIHWPCVPHHHGLRSDFNVRNQDDHLRISDDQRAVHGGGDRPSTSTVQHLAGSNALATARVISIDGNTSA